MLSKLQEYFSNFEVPRQRGKVSHELQDILLVFLVGVICWADGWEAIEEVRKSKLELLKKYGSFEMVFPFMTP